MERTLLSIVWICCAYLLGSLPVGVLLARLKGRDPRKVGSGNIGATNVMRTAGKAMGAATLLGDALKGFLPVWLAMLCNLPVPVIAAAGLAAFAGHLFPIYLKFKGGKGIATALGIFLAIQWFAVLFALAVFVLVLEKWRYVSLGSLVCAALMPFVLYAFREPLPYVALSAVMAVLIFIRHRANIKRLQAGTENKIGKKESRSSNRESRK